MFPADQKQRSAFKVCLGIVGSACTMGLAMAGFHVEQWLFRY